MREVEFLKEGAPTILPLYHKGKFHQWGSTIIEDSDGNTWALTIGIVEDEIGQIHMVQPKHIQFMS